MRTRIRCLGSFFRICRISCHVLRRQDCAGPSDVMLQLYFRHPVWQQTVKSRKRHPNRPSFFRATHQLLSSFCGLRRRASRSKSASGTLEHTSHNACMADRHPNPCITEGLKITLKKTPTAFTIAGLFVSLVRTHFQIQVSTRGLKSIRRLTRRSHGEVALPVKLLKRTYELGVTFDGSILSCLFGRKRATVSSCTNRLDLTSGSCHS